MFVQTITAPPAAFEQWNERLGIVSEPPAALVASIAWDAGDGQVMGLNLWDSAEAIADFFMERIRPFVEAEGEPANKPQVHGEPIVVYIRKG